MDLDKGYEAMDLAVPPLKVGQQHQSRGTSLPLEGEVIMVWGLIRITIFSISFCAGLIFIGPRLSPADSNSFNAPRLNEHVGASLIVACEKGAVVVKRIRSEHGVVQLECGRSEIVVIRDRSNQAIPDYHLLGM